MANHERNWLLRAACVSVYLHACKLQFDQFPFSIPSSYPIGLWLLSFQSASSYFFVEWCNVALFLKMCLLVFIKKKTWDKFDNGNGLSVIKICIHFTMFRSDRSWIYCWNCLNPHLPENHSFPHTCKAKVYLNHILFGVTSINVRIHTHTLMLTHRMSKKWNETNKNAERAERKQLKWGIINIERTKWTGTVVGLCGQRINGWRRGRGDTQIRSDPI